MARSAHWTDNAFIGLDFESTSPKPQEARIIQAAVVTDPIGLDEDRIVYINPGIEIPAEASAIHGITLDKLAELGAMDSREGVEYISGCLHSRSLARGYPVVIFNVTYDYSLLVAERTRHGLDKMQRPMLLDPLVIDRFYDRYRKGSRKLDAVCAHDGVKLDGAHDAGADARAALGVMRALVKQFPELRKQSLEQMQTLQAGWYLDWRDHINEYWARTGKSDRITGTWPMGEEEKAA